MIFIAVMRKGEPMEWIVEAESLSDFIDHGRYTIHTKPLIRCRDCKYWQDQQEGVVEVPICARPENKYEKLPFRFIIGEDGFCSFAERRTYE